MSLLTRFRNYWYGNRDEFYEMDPAAFQKWVLSFLRRSYRKRKFLAKEDPFLISSNEIQLGLQNIYAIYRRDHLLESDLETFITDYYHNIFSQIQQFEETQSISWSEAQLSLRPQLMPQQYTQAHSIVSFPFHHDVVIGFVIDREQSYLYVREEDMNAWGVTLEEVFSVSIDNLDMSSGHLDMNISTSPEAFLGVETKDGYDAIRLLLPQFRFVAAERLGEPFFAAIPNRDFLFCWSRECSPEFHTAVREKVSEDNRVQPYPLTATIFEVTRESIKPLMNQEAVSDK